MENKTIKELAIELTVETTAVCDNIKGRSVFVNQLLRSCSSIGANSHEAQYAQSRADFINKMEIALKECHETAYWIEILFRLDALDEATYKQLSTKCGTIRRKLISFVTTAKKEWLIFRGLLKIYFDIEFCDMRLRAQYMLTHAICLLGAICCLKATR